MKSLLVLVVLAGSAHADSIDAIVRGKLAMPANLGVAKVFVPASLDKAELDPATVAVEPPRDLRAGRASVKVTVRNKSPIYVPVAIAALADVAVAQRAIPAGHTIGSADVAIERRALDGIPPAVVVGAVATVAIAAGEPIGARDIALPPPLVRGTQVAVEIRRGNLAIRGTATLEAAARSGEPASARLAQTHTIVKGTLVAPATLVVGGAP